MVIWIRRTPERSYSDYTRYKNWLREDFQYQCVYCSIHEGEFGGYLSFHIDHYKPKNDFPALVNEYTNLLYSCCRCNDHKGCDWPSDDPINSGIGYLDPCTHDYEDYFTIQLDGSIIGDIKVAKYMIEKLFLNKPLLIKIRNQRKRIQENLYEYQELLRNNDVLIDQETDGEIRKVLSEKKQLIIEMINKIEEEIRINTTPPYEMEDIKREV